MNLYAIGDIHGRFDLLERALSWIENEAGLNKAHIVFLGDYIDRGPDSKLVIETLMNGPRRKGDKFSCIRGNHEQICIEAQYNKKAMKNWMWNGGEEALASYGGTIPSGHISWMESLPFYIEQEHTIFVHAGLEPSMPIDQQDNNSLIWIRDSFLESDHNFGKHIVHGHTPIGPELCEFRTNLDSGAFMTGKLSIGVFGSKGHGKPSSVTQVTLGSGPINFLSRRGMV